MDEQEFRRKLSEVAEWQIPDVLEKSTKLIIKEKPNYDDNLDMDQELDQPCEGDQDDCDDSDEHGETSGIRRYQKRTYENRSLPPVITRLKIQSCTCEDCGKFCENGRQKEKKYYNENKAIPNHWRTHCVTCNRWRHPITGEFTLTPYNISSVYVSYLKTLKSKDTNKTDK